MGASLRIAWNTLGKDEYMSLCQQAVHPLALQQSYAYGEMAAHLGALVLRACIYENDVPIAICQFHGKSMWGCLRLALAMRGPVWLKTVDNETATQALRLLRHDIPLKAPRLPLIMPEWAKGSPETTTLKDAGLRQLITSYHTVMIDLQQDEDALLAAMDGKWRNRLRAAERNGVTALQGSLKPEQYLWLLAKEAQQRRAIGYVALNPEAVVLYQAIAGKKSLLILKSMHENSPSAGVMALIHGHTATYHIGWSSEEGKKSGAHNVLMWELMRQLKARGIKWLDLGGVNTEDAAGIARFKIGTGGKVVSLCGTYW